MSVATWDCWNDWCLWFIHSHKYSSVSYFVREKKTFDECACVFKCVTSTNISGGEHITLRFTKFKYLYNGMNADCIEAVHLCAPEWLTSQQRKNFPYSLYCISSDDRQVTRFFLFTVVFARVSFFSRRWWKYLRCSHQLAFANDYWYWTWECKSLFLGRLVSAWVFDCCQLIFGEFLSFQLPWRKLYYCLSVCIRVCNVWVFAGVCASVRDNVVRVWVKYYISTLFTQFTSKSRQRHKNKNGKKIYRRIKPKMWQTEKGIGSRSV